MDLFQAADVENTGYLQQDRLMPLLEGADLGLSHVQLNAIVSEARADDNESEMKR